MYSPRPAFAGLPRYADDELEGEIAALERAAAAGALSERELLRRAQARRWGPGRGHRALRAAVRRGRLVRRGRTYVAPEPARTAG